VNHSVATLSKYYMLLRLCDAKNKEKLQTFLQGDATRKYWMTSVLE